MTNLKRSFLCLAFAGLLAGQCSQMRASLDSLAAFTVHQFAIALCRLFPELVLRECEEQIKKYSSDKQEGSKVHTVAKWMRDNNFVKWTRKGLNFAWIGVSAIFAVKDAMNNNQKELKEKIGSLKTTVKEKHILISGKLGKISKQIENIPQLLLKTETNLIKGIKVAEDNIGKKITENIEDPEGTE